MYRTLPWAMFIRASATDLKPRWSTRNGGRIQTLAALNVLLTSLISLLPADTLTAYMEVAGQVLLGNYGVLSVLIRAVLAPLTEEVLFRGLVYGNLKKALPRRLAVVLASAVFGLMHGQVLWTAYTALLGAFFCVVRDRYDSLWASVVLHMSFNAGSYLVMAANK